LKSPLLLKITLIILGISFAGVLISGLIINLSVNHQFQTYLNRVEQGREDQIIEVLIDIYREFGGWPQQPIRIRMGQGFLGNFRYATDLSGKLTVITGPGLFSHGPAQNHQRSRTIAVDGKPVGIAYFGPTAIQDFLSRQNAMFRHTIKRSIIVAIFFIGLISLLAAVLLARQISLPITEMNRIAKDMTMGNLESRVEKLPHDELGELGNSLNRLAERLRQVENLRKQMTADVAHDLRTPLTTVRSHLEGMIDQVIHPSPENLNSLLEEVNRLTALVEDLQEIALVDSAIHRFAIEPLQLDKFLAEQIKKMGPSFNEKGVRLETGLFPAVTLPSDRDALGKILDNLLSNALKFTPAGQGVRVELEKMDNWAIISVSDAGIGIAATDLPFIFERFYRTDRSRNRKSGGFGLGLAIVKELVEALGGTVSVTSVPGKGSAFMVKLPFNQNRRN
jgi:two-component system sensor histidine kinase BaeS